MYVNVLAYFCAIIVFVWITKKWIIDENTLKTFGKKFLKFEKKERERLLKKYIKSKNDSEQTTAKNVFFEYFKDISKDTREEIFEYLLNNYLINNKPIKKTYLKEIEIRDLLEILDKYFNDFSPSFRNNMVLKMIEAKDFHIEGVIRNHLKEIPTEILNKAFIELGEDEGMMEILYEYDKSACIDEKMKEEALRKYVEIWWINADVEILKKFLERGIQDKKLREDIMTLLSLEEKRQRDKN